jgi:hypothetical protein
MPSRIGIFVNGWAVSLNRTPNATMLQSYTPAAELSDTGDFVAEFTKQNHEPLDESRRGSISRRAHTALTQAVETKDDFNRFRNLQIFRIRMPFTAPWFSDKNPGSSQWYHQNVNYLTCHVFETSSEVRTEQKQFLNYTR